MTKQTSSSAQANSLLRLLTGCKQKGDNGVDGLTKPSWFDQEKFERGQQFYRRHILCITFAMHCSLVVGFSLPNLLEPLVFTKASDSATKSLRRYVWTFYHIFQWMTSDPFDENSDAHSSMKVVRQMHKSVARDMSNLSKDKVYISQYDMGLVQSGFFGMVLLYPEHIGIRCSRADLDDFVFVWRVIGYCLGIEDKYNICCDSVTQTQVLVKEIEKQRVMPCLLDPPDDFDRMADIYIEGVNITSRQFRLHSKESLLLFIVNCSKMKLIHHTGLADNVRYYLLRGLFGVMYLIPKISQLLNRMFYNALADKVVAELRQQQHQVTN